jgi:hypothetical protein
VGLENFGRGLAKNVAVEIELRPPYNSGDVKYEWGEQYGFKTLRRLGAKAKLVLLGAETVIHPTSSLRVALISFEATEASLSDLVIEVEIMAEDMQAVKEKKVITGEEIKAQIVPSSR